MSKIELLNASCADIEADAIVNAANRYLDAGGGICGVIFSRAGYRELGDACCKFNTPLNDGDAVITPSFNMRNSKYIIHAVGPDFNETNDAYHELFLAYYNSLLLLKENNLHSISFPLISSGIFGGNLDNPSYESAKQCELAYNKFTGDYPDYDIHLYLCAYTYNEYLEARKIID